MNVKDLKNILVNVSDNVEVIYERIEDEYFDKHGWESMKLLTDLWFDRTFNADSEETEWVEAYDNFYNKKENKFKIMAHY